MEEEHSRREAFQCNRNEKGDDEEEYALPLAREGRHPGTDAARRLKGRDAEGSFQAGSLKMY
jgi:hypothetical protein